MEWLKVKLATNEKIFITWTTILFIVGIFLVTFISELPKWLSIVLGVVLLTIGAILTNSLLVVVKEKIQRTIQKNDTNIQTSVNNLTEHMSMLHEKIEQLTTLKQSELLNKIEETKTELSRELRENVELVNAYVQQERSELATILTTELALGKNSLQSTIEQFSERQQNSSNKIQGTIDYLQQWLDENTNANTTAIIDVLSKTKEVLLEKDAKNVEYLSGLLHSTNDSYEKYNEKLIDLVKDSTNYVHKYTLSQFDSLTTKILNSYNKQEEQQRVLHEEVLGKILVSSQRVQENTDSMTKELQKVVIERSDSLQNHIEYVSKETINKLDQTDTSLENQFNNLGIIIKDSSNEINEMHRQSTTFINNLFIKRTDALQEEVLTKFIQTTNQILDAADTKYSELTKLFIDREEGLLDKLLQLKDISVGLEQKLLEELRASGEEFNSLIDTKYSTLKQTTASLQETIYQVEQNITKNGNTIISKLQEQYELQQSDWSNAHQVLHKKVDDSITKLVEQTIQTQSEVELIINERHSENQTRVGQLSQIIENVQSQLSNDFTSNKEQTLELLLEVKQNRQIIANQLDSNEKYLHHAIESALDKNNKFTAGQLDILKKSVKAEMQSFEKTFEHLTNFTKELTSVKNDLLQQINIQIKTLQSNSEEKNNELFITLSNVDKQIDLLGQNIANTKAELIKQKSSIEGQIHQIIGNYGEKLTTHQSNAEIKLENEINRIARILAEQEAMYNQKIDSIDLQLDTINSLIKLVQSSTQLPIVEQFNQVNQVGKSIPTGTLVKEKAEKKNRTEKIEDIENDLTIVNEFENNVLRRSDMFKENRKTYTVFYDAKGAIASSVNYDSKGQILTEMNYYPNGNVKERIEHTKKNGHIIKVKAKFDTRGKRLH